MIPDRLNVSEKGYKIQLLLNLYKQACRTINQVGYAFDIEYAIRMAIVHLAEMEIPEKERADCNPENEMPKKADIRSKRKE